MADSTRALVEESTAPVARVAHPHPALWIAGGAVLFLLGIAAVWATRPYPPCWDSPYSGVCAPNPVPDDGIATTVGVLAVAMLAAVIATAVLARGRLRLPALIVLEAALAATLLVGLALQAGAANAQPIITPGYVVDDTGTVSGG